MKIRVFSSREEWMNWREGRITGSTVYKTVTTKDGSIKDEVYQKAAENICGSAVLDDTDDDEFAMQRGTRLEPEAVERFVKETGKKFKWSEGYKVGWESEDDPRMSFSPDAANATATEAVEVKCLSAKLHCKALITKKIPKPEYEYQVTQGFIVNPKLKTLYFVFYDPRWPAPLDYFCIVITRKERKKEIERVLALEKNANAKIREMVNSLTMYHTGVEEVKKVQDELLKQEATVGADKLKKWHKEIKERELS